MARILRSQRYEEFSNKERSIIYDALVEYWNAIPIKHVRKRADTEKLKDAFNPENERPNI